MNNGIEMLLVDWCRTTVLQSMKLGVDVNRHKEIIVKAISAILLLLLKHFKLNHVYQVRFPDVSDKYKNITALLLPFSAGHEAAKCPTRLKCHCLSRSLSTWLNIWCLPTASPSFWSSSTRTSCLILQLRTGTREAVLYRSVQPCAHFQRRPIRLFGFSFLVFQCLTFLTAWCTSSQSWLQRVW